MPISPTQHAGASSRAREQSPSERPAGDDDVGASSTPTTRNPGQLEGLPARSARITRELQLTPMTEESPQATGHALRGSAPRRSASDAGGLKDSIARALARTAGSRQEALADIRLQLSETSASFREAIAEHDLEAGIVVRPQAEVPQGPLAPGFPTTIAHWQMAVQQERNRRCDPAAIAQVLNEVRGKGAENIHESHSDAIKRIKPEHVAAWRQGIGLTQDDVELMERNSRTVGRLIPSSSTLFNLVNYGIVPWLPSMAPNSDAAHDGHKAKGLKNPINNAMISIGIAGVVQPLMTALIQTPIVAALDTWRKKMGPVVTLDAGVNAKLTPQKAAAKLDEASSELRGIQTRIEGIFREMARAYDIPVDQPLTEAQVGEVVSQLNHDADGARQAGFMSQLADAGKDCLEAEGDVRERSDQVRMSTGVQDRQWQSTTHQILPRVARAASSYVTPIGRWIERAHHRDPTPYTTIAAVGAAGVSMVWQHFAAGTDEVEGAANVEEKLNMLYGTSYLKPEGVEALRQGSQFQPEHLDEAKLRAMAPGAASQMLDRVHATIDNYRKGLSADKPEHAAKLAEYDNDLRALKENDLQSLVPGGDAGRLMHEVIGGGSDRHPVMFAAREGWNKLNSLEITAQIGQRLGVAWMLGAFGNVGATAGGRMVTALKGGSSHASLPVQFGASTLSSAFGAASAVTNYMAVNVKNERRADPDSAMTLKKQGKQLFDTVTSPFWQRRQGQAARASTSAAGEAIGDASTMKAAAKDEASKPTEGSGN
jgi:hypothetical protein